MNKRFVCRVTATAVVLALTAVGPTAAAPTATWSASTAADLSRGQLEGTALDGRGRVVLAPRMDTMWGPAEGIVWDVAALPDGGAALGMSGPGKLVVFPGGEGPETHHEVPDEGMVTAVAVDAAGGVLFGVSPEGTVHRVVGDGDAEPLLETSAKFVWALAVDSAGDVWVGTGIPGGLWRARPGGDLELVHDSGDDPVRCITPVPGGGVVFGTGGEGRVARVAADGSLFVVFDADEKEIVALAVTGDVIHVLAADSAKQIKIAGAAPPLPAGAMRVVARPANSGNGGNGNGNGEDKKDNEADKPPAPKPAPQQFRTGSGGALYVLEADGGSRRIWETLDAMPFDLLRNTDGSSLVATGDKGHVLRIGDDGRTAVLARVPAKQASGLARASDGSILVAGTTDALLSRLSDTPVEQGVYLSEPVDAQRPADWGRVRWTADVPRGAGIALRARSGNTGEPDATWSEWSAVDADAAVRVPAARWLQLEASLESGRGGSPALRRLEVDFVARNRAPVVRELQIHPAGVVWVVGPVQMANRLGPLVADDPVARETSAQISRTAGISPIRRGYETGARTVSWKSADDDGDRLLHTVEIQRDGEEVWHTVASELKDGFFSWDARSYPSGTYRIRVTADDRLDNARGRNRPADRVSEVFLIDNDRPAVNELKVAGRDDGLHVSFVAVDRGGRIRAAEIKVGGGAWQPVAPLDGIADSPRELYRFSLEDSPAGPSIQIRVTDAGGNLGGALWAAGGS